MVRSVGKLANLATALKQRPLVGTVGIGLRNERDLVLGNVGDGDLTITAFEGLELGFSVSRQPAWVLR